METQVNNTEQENNDFEKWSQRRRSGRILGGIIIVIVGSLLLARENGADLPYWIFSWKTMMIVIGVYIGARHSFKGFGWLMPIIVGGAFILSDLFGFSMRSYWPIFIILAGLFIMLRPKNERRRWKCEQKYKNRYGQWDQSAPGTSEDRIEVVSIFGGVKKKIISKDFKGGDITSIFGGSEVDLSQADINGEVVLETAQVFGGTKLVVPPHWEVRTEVVAILGGADDNRPRIQSGHDPSKVLIIKGSSVFGGLEINSY